MDSEELAEIAFHQKNGRPETTKGPYYHKSWWESYKGAVKGILGGVVIGGLIGAGVGGLIIGALTVASVDVAGYVGIILASTTLFGIYEGKEKFEKVGITSGAVAAASEISEVRMKEYIREKLTGLTNEIRELKAAIAGKKPMDAIQTNPAAPDTSPIFDESDFRTTHCDEHCAPEDSKLIFWNVAAIGALVGTAVTAIVAFAGGQGHALVDLLGPHLSLSVEAANTAIVTAGAALGASFGINRDVFRKIFDVTDCWFMGVADGKCSTEDIAHALGKEPPKLAPHKPLATNNQLLGVSGTPSPIVSESSIAEQQTTRYTDKILAEKARNALLSMDHTTALRH